MARQAKKTVRKNGQKIPQHRVYKKPVKPLTAEDLALADAALELAAAEGHKIPTKPSAKGNATVAQVANTRKVKPVDPGIKGKGKTTKTAALARKATAGKPKNETTAAPASDGAKEAKADHCKICGKPLTKAESMQSGAGDVCRHKFSLLPAGITSFHDYRMTMTVDDIPDGWIKLLIVCSKAYEAGVTKTQFLRAVGGDRHLVPPTDPVFKVVFVKNTRYMSPESIKHFDKMKAL